jgi:kynurenine formamidase
MRREALRRASPRPPRADAAAPPVPFDSLPQTPEGGRRGWGCSGVAGDLGRVQLQTAARIAAAAALVRRGSVFRLDAPLDAITPPLFGRQSAEHHVTCRDEIEFDDRIDNLYLQSSSHWDSLGHVAARAGEFYNGASSDDVAAARRNTIEHWAGRGIVGRALLLDVGTLLARENHDYHPSDPYAITTHDLERARETAGVEFLPGDVVLIRTGFLGWYACLDGLARKQLADRDEVPAAGLAHTEEMARYLWDSQASAVASDNPAVEVEPAGADPLPFGVLHHALIGEFGMALGELWWLDDLAADCAEDGVYEMLLVSAPLFVRGGIGSPANALAIK